MTPRRLHQVLLAGALGAAAVGAALGWPAPEPARALSPEGPEALAPLLVARILSEGGPADLVLYEGTPSHALRGAWPLSSFGPSDDELARQAPRARRIVLAMTDPVRADRLARRLLATGRRVAVVRDGVAGWDRAMTQDPPTPAAGASASAWSAFRRDVALRRAFGEAGAAPPPASAPPPAALTAPPAGARRREGC